MEGRGVQCDSCGEPFIGTVNFCFKCGADQHHRLRCEYCSELLLGQVAYCPNCGGQQRRESRRDVDRHYQASPLPMLRTSAPPEYRSEILFTIYKEVSASWRTLTDVRFRLLALVPAMSTVIWVFLFDPGKFPYDTGSPKPGGMFFAFLASLVSLFGLVVIIALHVYERRNSELYDDLISRGRRIELELGVDTGQFLGRLESTKHYFGGILVKHDHAIDTIYRMTIGGWVVTLALSLFFLGKLLDTQQSWPVIAIETLVASIPQLYLVFALALLGAGLLLVAVRLQRNVTRRTPRLT
ncbi:MAG TPA: zinc ribbon domain-containing protein [Chloroflexota bacterium]|nr:zinc ribbon domain-containing protein [Chloroflexota bacterium]